MTHDFSRSLILAKLSKNKVFHRAVFANNALQKLDLIARIFPKNDKFTVSYQKMRYLPKALRISNVANNKNEV